MGSESATRLAEQVISRLGGRQHGVVARRQLLEAGVSARQITVRLDAGRLTELHRGVYLTGTVKPEHANEMAALLAFRLEATLSHRSAAMLWSLLAYPAAAYVCVTVGPERRAERPRIKVFRSQLETRDIRRLHGMALTSPPRTILDCSALLHDSYELERLVAEAQYRRIATESELRIQLERNPGKRGTHRLRKVLDLPGGPKRTRSSGERALLRLLRERRIDGFEANPRITGYEVDFLWRDAKLAIEVDGYDAHAGRVAFERDRLKVAVLKAHGISVMPVTGRQIRRDPDGVVRACSLRSPMRGERQPALVPCVIRYSPSLTTSGPSVLLPLA